MFSFLKILFFLVFLVGCATYQSKIEPARQMLTSGNCEGSLVLLSDLSSKPSSDQLIYLMDYGSALQICHKYEESNKIFLQAERLADDLDYTSVSKVVGATLFNEEFIQYKGDTFEKLFLNVSIALNFLKLGDLDSAQVEVRKINEKFNKYSKENKNKFELNAFSQYLAALIYEAVKKYDDACISYKAAYFLDESYRTVAIDMLKSCWKANRTSEFNSLVKKISATAEEVAKAKAIHSKKNSSEVIIIFLQGWGPRKRPRPEAPTFPRLEPVYSETQFLQTEVFKTKANEKSNFRSEPVYSFESAAIKTLDADYNSLVARRIGSRVAKHVLADQLRQKNEALGAVALIAMVASERADLRQWSIYPKTLQIARIPLDVGEYDFKFKGLNSNGEESETFNEQVVKVSNKNINFIIIRSLK